MYRWTILVTCLMWCVSPLESSFGANPLARMDAVKQAAIELGESKQWQHLDSQWVDSVFSQATDGSNRPEMTVVVTVTTHNNQPVAGALVALQESRHELINRYPGQVHDIPVPDTVRSLAVTDAAGRCSFERVRMTPPGADKDGRIAAYVAVAHRDHGVGWKPLLKMSRKQDVAVTLKKQTSVRVVVNHEGKSMAGIVVRPRSLSAESQRLNSLADFEFDQDFGPRCVTDEKGIAEFSHLPSDSYCRLVASDEKGEFTYYSSTSSWKLGSAEKIEFEVEKPDRESFRGRFVDAETGDAIEGVRVGWAYVEDRDVSNEDGNISSTRYATGISNQEGVKLFELRVSPPDGWVAERLMMPLTELLKDHEVKLTPATNVRGRIVDAVSGSGIAGVIVKSFQRHIDSDELNSYYDSVAISDHQGNFSIGLASGEQTVRILPPVFGYHAPITRRSRDQKASPPAFLSRKVTVAADQEVEDLRFSLAPAKPIRGIVLDDAGAGVNGAEVFCYRSERRGSIRDHIPTVVTVTTAETTVGGMFSIAAPSGESESLSIKSRLGDRESQEFVFQVDLQTGQTPEVGLKLGAPTKTIELVGRVMKDGKPWVGVKVKARPHNSPRGFGRFDSNLGEVETDTEGRFRMKLRGGDFDKVIVSAGDQYTRSPIVLLNGPIVNVPTMEFMSEQRGEETIRGVVVDPLGLPIEGLSVRASVRSPNNMIRRTRRKPDPHETVTDDNGWFTINEVFEDAVQLTVNLPFNPNAPRTVGRPTQVSVIGGTQDAQIVFDPKLGQAPVLIEPTSITELASDESLQEDRNDATADGLTTIEGFVIDDKEQPISGATVRVFCAQPREGLPRINPVAHPVCSLITTTDEEGIFLIGPIDADLKVRLVAGAENHHATVGDFVTPTVDVEAEILELSRVPESTGPGRVKRILKDADGNLLPHALLSPRFSVTDSDIQDFRSRPGQCMMTDANGQFDYDARALGSGLIVFPIDRPASLLRIGIRDGDYPPVSGFAITGRIMDDGEPVSGYAVCLRSGFSTPGTIRVATDHRGRFRVDGVAKSSEYVLFGDIEQLSAKHLVTRRFSGNQSGKLLDFGDLSLEKSHELAVKVIPAAGKEIPPMITVRCKLMSGGSSITTVVSPLGDTVLEHVPGEPIEIWIGGRVGIQQTLPPMQRLYNPGQFGISISNDQVLIIQLK